MVKWTVGRAVIEVLPGVFFVEGPAANWVILTEPDSRRFTLIDTGYPGDWDRLLASLAHVGRSLDDCAALLITHGHSDHIGSAALVAAHGVPVYAHELELANIRREISEQITVKDLGWRVLGPRVLVWAAHAVAAGGLGDVAVQAVQPLDEVVLASVPGGLEAIHTGGHTTGHTAYLCKDAGLLVCGDVLISGHAISPWEGLQLLPALFHVNPAGIREAAAKMERPELVWLLPGHGPAWTLPQGQPADFSDQGVLSADYWPFGRQRS